jgi:hypothetical protein
MTDRYRWRGGEELMMRWGAHLPLQVLLFEPLFEEKNRTRRLIAQVAARLERFGIGLAVPDLPGTGESLTEIACVSIANWTDAAKSVVSLVNPVCVASIRGGALLDCVLNTPPVWRFSPETGARLVRDLRRMQVAGGDTDSLGGHKLSTDFILALESTSPATPTHVRTLRLSSDMAEADHKLDAAPLWRRAEPGEDPVLAEALAKDLADWTKSCAAF